MFAASGHIDDNALIRRYLAERGLEVLGADDEPILKHLAHCEMCQARYVQAKAGLDDGRDLSVAAADAAFTPDRLAAQRERIMRRIESQNGARVLAFPAPAAAERVPMHARPMLRWVAAAAVAGIMVGITAGRYVNIGDLGLTGRHTATSASRIAAVPRPTPELRPVGNSAMAQDDDELLSEIDGALTEPRTSELAPIYALTMRGHEVPRQAIGKY